MEKIIDIDFFYTIAFLLRIENKYGNIYIRINVRYNSYENTYISKITNMLWNKNFYIKLRMEKKGKNQINFY